jgi:hypothetical protein
MAQVSEVFVEGTEPHEPTVLEGVRSGISGLIHKVFGASPSTSQAAAAPPSTPINPAAIESDTNQTSNPTNGSQQQQGKKKGVLKKLFGIFKGGSKH